MKIKVTQSDGEIRINKAGRLSVYEVKSGAVTVADDDPNIASLKALAALTAPAGPTPTPETPADQESEAI